LLYLSIYPDAPELVDVHVKYKTVSVGEVRWMEEGCWIPVRYHLGLYSELAGFAS